MKYISVKEALGKKLGYDTTLVTPQGASVLLPRGHIISEEDINKLMDSGVYYVWVDEGEEEKDIVYEWDITPYVASKIVGENVKIVQGKQGATLLHSKVPGILQLDIDGIVNFNLNQKVLIITGYENEAFGKDELIGFVEVIPLSMKKSELESLISSSRALIDIIPFKYKKIGLVITGTEIYEGRKQDQYYPVIKAKCDRYGWEIVSKEIVPDDEDKIEKAIRNAKDNGAEAIIVTGGTSVDPTDRTIHAIKRLANVVAYGVPMKPTTMSIVAYWDSTPIFGVSAGGIFHREYNSIDKVFTLLMAGIKLTQKDIAKMGIGGLSWAFRQTIKSK